MGSTNLVPFAQQAEVNTAAECVEFGFKSNGRNVILKGEEFPKECYVYRLIKPGDEEDEDK